MFEDDRELVAAEPGHGVGAPDHAEQALGDRDQQPVAGQMAVAVVDRLEAVEIDEDHRDQVAVALEPAERLAQPVLEQRPIRQAGQGVVPGQLAELALDPLALDRVPDRAAQQAGIALALDQIVLGAVEDRLEREPLVVQAAQHQHRQTGRHPAQLADRPQPGNIRQHEVEQDDVEPPRGHAPERGRERSDPGDPESVERGRLERGRDVTRIIRVVIDQEHLVAREGSHRNSPRGTTSPHDRGCGHAPTSLWLRNGKTGGRFPLGVRCRRPVGGL